MRDNLGLHAKYDTEIYSIDEHGLIMSAFEEIASSD
jgi:hypothetical protein